MFFCRREKFRHSAQQGIFDKSLSKSAGTNRQPLGRPLDIVSIVLVKSLYTILQEFQALLHEPLFPLHETQENFFTGFFSEGVL